MVRAEAPGRGSLKEEWRQGWDKTGGVCEDWEGGCKTNMQSVLLGEEVADREGRAVAGWRGRVTGWCLTFTVQ